ncbi:hypothetical protein [Actinomadura rifamycini]|nr:hypothetical protein [Actinomadura rifamycini]
MSAALRGKERREHESAFEVFGVCEVFEVFGASFGTAAREP